MSSKTSIAFGLDVASSISSQQRGRTNTLFGDNVESLSFVLYVHECCYITTRENDAFLLPSRP